MRSGTAEVPIDDDHCHEDGKGIHEEGEEEIFRDEGKHQGRRWQDFADQ